MFHLRQLAKIGNMYKCKELFPFLNDKMIELFPLIH